MCKNNNLQIGIGLIWDSIPSHLNQIILAVLIYAKEMDYNLSHGEQRTMTSSNGNIFRVTGPLWGESTSSPMDFPNKGQWRGALIFIWSSEQMVNRDAGDLRRHRAHYDVPVMVGTFVGMVMTNP